MARWDLRLCRGLAMQQAALLDGFGFDLPSPFEDGFGPAEIDIGEREVAEGLIVAVMSVVVDEVVDRRVQSFRQVVVLQEDAVLQGLVPARAARHWLPL